MACNNLILFYNPEASKSSLADVTSFSTNAIKRNIVQREYLLYNKVGTTQGTLSVLNNICIYETTPTITNTIANQCFTINQDTFIEKYSVVGTNTESRDSSGFVNENSIRFLNLTSVEGNPNYTKLKWILPVDAQGTPLTRTLVFYN